MAHDTVLFQSESGRNITIADFIRNTVQEKINNERRKSKLDPQDKRAMAYDSPSGKPRQSWNKFTDIISQYVEERSSKNENIDLEHLKTVIAQHVRIKFSKSSSDINIGTYRLSRTGLEDSLKNPVVFQINPIFNFNKNPKKLFKNPLLIKSPIYSQTGLHIESIQDSVHQLNQLVWLQKAQFNDANRQQEAVHNLPLNIKSGNAKELQALLDETVELNKNHRILTLGETNRKIADHRSYVIDTTSDILHSELKKLREEESKNNPLSKDFAESQKARLIVLYNTLTTYQNVEFSSQSAEVQFFMGYLEQSQGHYKKALAHYNQANSHMAGRHFRATHNIAHIHEQMGNYTASAGLFIELIQEESLKFNSAVKEGQNIEAYEGGYHDSNIGLGSVHVENSSKSNAALNLAVMVSKGKFSKKQETHLFNQLLLGNDRIPIMKSPSRDYLQKLLLKEALHYNSDNQTARFNLGVLYFQSTDKKVHNTPQAKKLLKQIADNKNQDRFDTAINPHFHGRNMPSSQYAYANYALSQIAKEEHKNERSQSHALKTLFSKQPLKEKFATHVGRFLNSVHKELNVSK